MASPGKDQRRKSDKAKAHAPNLNAWYRYHLPPLHPGAFEFELEIIRRGDPPLRIDHLVDTLDWDDERNVLTGSAVIHRPDVNDPSSLPVARGQLMRCRVRWDGGRYDLWEMRILAPQTQVDTGSVTVTLQDDLALLKADVQDWLFRKTKARPFGYMADEIARQVAKRVGLEVGELAKGTKRLNILKRHSSAYDILFAAYMEEHKHSHRSFVISIRNGRLNVRPLQRNALLYVLADEIQTALIAQKTGAKAPTTVLTGKATVGKGKNAKKISYTAYDRGVVNRLGYVHGHRSYGTVKDHAELRDKVKRDLARGLRLNNTISISHAGIPFILRGDGAEIDLPREGYDAKHAIVYCNRANHTVQASQFTSSFDFVARDPYRRLWGAEDKALRARAAKRVHRDRQKVIATRGLHHA